MSNRRRGNVARSPLTPATPAVAQPSAATATAPSPAVAGSPARVSTPTSAAAQPARDPSPWLGDLKLACDVPPGLVYLHPADMTSLRLPPRSLVCLTTAATASEENPATNEHAHVRWVGPAWPDTRVGRMTAGDAATPKGGPASAKRAGATPVSSPAQSRAREPQSADTPVSIAASSAPTLAAPRLAVWLRTPSLPRVYVREDDAQDDRVQVQPAWHTATGVCTCTDACSAPCIVRAARVRVSSPTHLPSVAVHSLTHTLTGTVLREAVPETLLLPRGPDDDPLHLTLLAEPRTHSPPHDAASPARLCVVCASTRLEYVGKTLESPDTNDALVAYPGTYGDHLNLLPRLTAAARAVFSHSSASSRGVLLYGPAGTGKTMVARELARVLGVPLHVVDAAAIASDVVGHAEAELRRLFAAARQSSPSIIFFDELDAIAPVRDGAGEAEVRVVTQLLTLLDGYASDSDAVFVLAATNRPSMVDPAVRRAGRFDEEIEVTVPSDAGRHCILRACLSALPHSLSPEDLRDIVSRTHGYVGADLTAVCNEAAIHSLRRAVESGMPVSIQLEDVHGALRKVQASALREIHVEVPTVRWSDVGGQEDVKAMLREAVELPLLRPDVFERLGIAPSKGLLLYGPPGCSKTMMARAIATESRMNFIAVKGPELFSRYVGDSEKAVAEVFHRARQVAPCVIFFDEFDAMGGARGGGGSSHEDGPSVGTRVVSQMLAELDGITALRQVVVIAATNRPDLIDKALLRPGRIDRRLYVGPPDAAARRHILHKLCAGVPCDDDIDMDATVTASAGFSGAEVVGMFRDACVRALSESLVHPRLSTRHLREACANVRPQITSDMLEFYAAYGRSR